MEVANTLAYYDTLTITAVKSLIVQGLNEEAVYGHIYRLNKFPCEPYQ